MSLATTISAAQQYLPAGEVDCLVYHYPCVDGAGAAMSAWLARGTEISYVPLDYRAEFPEEQLRDKKVILIDCAFRKDQLHHIKNIANKVMILDHHDTAMKNLKNEPGCFFTMDNSGAALGWHYFHGLDKPLPDFLTLIEDRDLWTWRYRERSEPLFHALTDLYKKPDFKAYAAYLDSKQLESLIEHGKEVMLGNKTWCERMISKAQRCIFTLPGTNEHYTVMSLELESDRLVSELSEYLYTNNDVDFVLLWFKLPDNKYKLSFRNNRDTINVGDIASSLGGGGHPRAAGAVLGVSPQAYLYTIKAL